MQDGPTNEEAEELIKHLDHLSKKQNLNRDNIDDLIERIKQLELASDQPVPFELARAGDSILKRRIEEIDAITADIESIARQMELQSQKSQLQISIALSNKYLAKFPNYHQTIEELGLASSQEF